MAHFLRRFLRDKQKFSDMSTSSHIVAFLGSSYLSEISDNYLHHNQGRIAEMVGANVFLQGFDLLPTQRIPLWYYFKTFNFWITDHTVFLKAFLAPVCTNFDQKSPKNVPLDFGSIFDQNFS